MGTQFVVIAQVTRKRILEYPGRCVLSNCFVCDTKIVNAYIVLCFLSQCGNGLK